jgi:hypothetical protein
MVSIQLPRSGVSGQQRPPSEQVEPIALPTLRKRLTQAGKLPLTSPPFSLGSSSLSEGKIPVKTEV